MKHFRNRRKRWRTKWPWKHLFPLRIDERYCKECGQTYHEGPYPTPVADHVIGNIGVIIHPSGDWRRREFVIHAGKWTRSPKGFYLSEIIPENELDDLFEVLEWAEDKLPELRKDQSARAAGLHRGSRSGSREVPGRPNKQKAKVRHQG